MKILADWLPIILFFVVYKFSDLYWATGVAIAATLIVMAVLKARGHTIEAMQWVSLGLIVLFGGATIFLQDERFIKLKPTLLYGLFAVALLGPQLFSKTLLMQKFMGSKIDMPRAAWAKLNAAWGIFFAVLGALNLWVANSFSTDTWVNFKLFGTIGLMGVFIVAQALWMNRFASAELPDALKDKDSP
ncbi:MAG: septation protein A [Burkholderiaceae bacterium]|nr:septation protein A [Burkholderiaceae bacterium]